MTDRTLPLMVLVSQDDLDVMATFDVPTVVAQHAVDSAIDQLRLAKAQSTAIDKETVVVVADTKAHAESWTRNNHVALFALTDKRVQVVTAGDDNVDRLRGVQAARAVVVGAVSEQMMVNLGIIMRSEPGQIVRLGPLDRLAEGWRDA